jgi:hypothetical protein
MELVVRGVSQVISSDAFALVLEYIYHLGNLLNFGDGVEYTSKVKSISISSLSKLSFTKAYDGRVSFLQYLVQSIEVRLSVVDRSWAGCADLMVCICVGSATPRTSRTSETRSTSSASAAGYPSPTLSCRRSRPACA